MGHSKPQEAQRSPRRPREIATSHRIPDPITERSNEHQGIRMGTTGTERATSGSGRSQ